MIMKEVQQDVCMECKGHHALLFQVEGYAMIPDKAEKQFQRIVYSYDLNNKHTLKYLVCESCTNKEMKSIRAANTLLWMVLSLWLLIVPVIFVANLLFGFAQFESDFLLLSIVLTLIWGCFVLLIVFRKNNEEKNRKAALNALVLRRLSSDYESRKIFPFRGSSVLRVQFWSEFTSVDKILKRVKS